MSNILDGKLVKREPVKGSHREVVRAVVVDSELPGEVIQGIKTVAGIEVLLILAVTSLHFTVVARRVGADELVADTQLCGSGFKESRETRLLLEKRLVNSKPLSVWTHSTRIPRRTYHLNYFSENPRRKRWAAPGKQPGSSNV